MKKIVLFSVFVLSAILFAVTADAYCVDCYYGNTHGYNNFAEHTYSTAYSYERPFGHSYYYQPFGITTTDYSGFGSGNGVYGNYNVQPKAQVRQYSTLVHSERVGSDCVLEILVENIEGLCF